MIEPVNNPGTSWVILEVDPKFTVKTQWYLDVQSRFQVKDEQDLTYNASYANILLETRVSLKRRYGNTTDIGSFLRTLSNTNPFFLQFKKLVKDQKDTDLYIYNVDLGNQIEIELVKVTRAKESAMCNLSQQRKLLSELFDVLENFTVTKSDVAPIMVNPEAADMDNYSVKRGEYRFYNE